MSNQPAPFFIVERVPAGFHAWGLYNACRVDFGVHASEALARAAALAFFRR